MTNSSFCNNDIATTAFWANQLPTFFVKLEQKKSQADIMQVRKRLDIRSSLGKHVISCTVDGAEACNNLNLINYDNQFPMDICRKHVEYSLLLALSHIDLA